MRGDSLSPDALGLTSITNFGVNYTPNNGPAVVSTTAHTKKSRIRLNDKLYATQPFAIAAKVAALPNRTPGNTPTVKREDGKTWVLDGHHRIAKAMKRGQKTITVSEYLSE